MDPLQTFKNSGRKVSQSQKMGLIVFKKVERETLLLWNVFVFHVRGFRCVQHEVLSTYGNIS